MINNIDNFKSVNSYIDSFFEKFPQGRIIYSIEDREILKDYFPIRVEVITNELRPS